MAGTQFDISSGVPLPGSEELPAITGDFTEATPPPLNGKAPAFPKVSPADAATERMRLNFQAGKGDTIAGGAEAITAKEQATAPTMPDGTVPGGTDFQNANPMAMSPGEQGFITDTTSEMAKRRLEDIEADQIAYKQMPSYKGFAQGAMSLGAQVTGMSLSPENVIFPEMKVVGSAVWRAMHPLLSDMISFGLGQAVVQGVVDPLKQAAEVKAGLKQNFDPVQTSLAIPSGFLFGAGLTAINHGASVLYKSGIDAFAGRLTEAMPALTPEVRATIPPEVQKSLGLTRELQTAAAKAPLEPSLAVSARPEPPVPDGTVRLYRADAPTQGASAEPGAQVAFTRDPVRAMDTPPMGAKAQARTEVSYIDVPENVALARSSGDLVHLPAEVADGRAKLPEPAAEATPDVALAAERETLSTKLDDLDYKLMNEAKPKAREKIQAQIKETETRLSAIRDEMKTAKTETLRMGAEGEVAPRVKGMAGNNAVAVPGGSRSHVGAGISSADALVAPVERLADVMRRVADTLNVSVRKGGLRGNESVAEYNFKTQIVRLKDATASGFQDFGHELGHHVENTVGKPLRDLINAHEQTMRAYGGPMVQNLRTPEGVSEGFGEFMASYITDRNRATQIDPGFVQKFRDVLAKTDPELLNTLDDASNAWQAYQAAPSRAVGESMIVSHTEVPTKPDYKDPLKRSPFALWASNAYTQMVNRQHPMQVAVRFLAEEYGKKYGKLMDLRPDQDPAKLMQMFGRGGHQMSVMDLTYGVQNAHTLKPEGPAFFSILKRVAADPIAGSEAVDGVAAAARMKAFDSYLVAKWHKSLRTQMSNGESDLTRSPTRLTDGDAAKIISETEQLHPEFAGLAEEVYAYNKLLVKKEYDAQLRTKESFDDLMHDKNHEYVPLRRDMREVTEAVKAASTTGRTAGLADLERFALKGSDRDIMSPTESIMLRTFSINDQMTENWVKLALRDLVRHVGGKEGAAIAEEIPNTAMRRLDVNTEETIYQAARKNGWTSSDARDHARDVMSGIGPEARVQLYRAEAIKAGNKPVIFGWDRGERFAMQLPDGEFGRQMQNVVDSLGPKGASTFAQTTGILVDILSASAGTLRAGATGTPTFMVKNVLRDAFMQYLLMPEANALGTMTLANSLKGGKSFLAGDEFYRMYAATEGVRGGIAANTIADTRKVGDMLKQAGVPGHKQLNAGSLKEVLGWMEISESAGRIGLFRKVYESNIALGRDERYAMFDAAQKARDFIDYSRVGGGMELMSRLVPFLNANFQGVDKFVRTYAGTPTNPGLFFKAVTQQQKDAQDAIRSKLVPRVAALAAISAGITYAQMDDPVYQRIPTQMRSQYWIFRLPFVKSGTYNLAGGDKVDLPDGMQGAWVVVPKPWEPASVFNIAERAVEFVNTGDPDKLMQAARSLRYSFSVPNPYDFPLIHTTAGLASNYDSFFQRPIVPDSMQKIAPHMQSNEYTNKLYVALAQGLNMVWNSKDARSWFRENIPIVGAAIGAAWSPIEAQYLMQGILGDWPRELGGMGGVAKSLINGEAPKVDDIPGLRAVLKSKMAAGEPMRELYNQVGQNDGRLTIAANTFKKAIADGDPASAQTYFSALDQGQRDYVRLKTVAAGPLVAALHPMDRSAAINTAVRNIRSGLQADGGMASFTDPSVRIKLEPGVRDVVSQTLNELAVVEARNSLIVQGVDGFKGIPLISTKPYFDALKQASPQVANELSARLADKKVYPIETIQKYWPEVQKTLRIGGEPSALATEIKGIGLDAAAQGYLGGAIRSGKSAVTPDGMRVKRGKTAMPPLKADGAVQ